MLCQVIFCRSSAAAIGFALANIALCDPVASNPENAIHRFTLFPNRQSESCSPIHCHCSESEPASGRGNLAILSKVVGPLIARSMIFDTAFLKLSRRSIFCYQLPDENPMACHDLRMESLKQLLDQNARFSSECRTSNERTSVHQLQFDQNRNS